MSNEEESSVEAMMEKLVAAANENLSPDVQTLTSEILASLHEEGNELPDLLKYRVQQTHCRALLSMKKYNDVISFCHSLSNEKECDSLLLERSYALYKLGRFVTCRDAIFKAAETLDMNSLSEDSVRGLKHILAQCHYRLHETEKATQIYGDLVGASNFDEGSEIVTNAMAASSANNSHNISSPILDDFNLNFSKELDVADAADGETEYPYEMVNNYATNLLQTSTNLAQTKHAIELLETAEDECKAIYDGNYEDTSFVKEIMPIRSNIAFGKILSGDLNGAMRSYLELSLSSKPFVEKDPSFNSGGGILATENNMVVLNLMRGSSHSVYDLLKNLPDISSASDSSSARSTCTINPYQIRIVLYNRALLFFRLGKMAEVKTVLNSLKASLSPNTATRREENGKKKKRKNTAGNFFATPVCETEKMFWECRIAILENEITTTGTLESIENSIKGAMKDGLQKFDEETLEYALAELELYQAQKAIQESRTFDDEAKKKVVATLEGLPKSIRNRPATVASLCSLYRSLGMDDKVELTLKASADSGMAEKRVADFKLRLGMYVEAASIYGAIIDSNDSSLSEEELMECTAGVVKALSHIDMVKAIDMASDLTIDESSDIPDGEELEAMEIPRLHKGAGTDSGRSRKIISSRRGAVYVCTFLFHRITFSTFTKLTIYIDISTRQRGKKKNQDAILRQRAKKRDSFLEKLQKDGKYNPDKPTKPDPERWIPKNQRSYNRRGRKGRNKFLGAQGGGTGFGADKEAAKLDAFARAAAKAQGKDISGGQPSTAHMSVLSSGRRRR